MTRKPLSVQVHAHVYCSSRGDHELRMTVRRGEQRLRVSLTSSGLDVLPARHRTDPERRVTMSRTRYPQYVFDAMADALLEAMQRDEWRVYEVDQFGDQHFEDLYYHERDELLSLLAWGITYIRNYKKGKQS